MSSPCRIACSLLTVWMIVGLGPGGASATTVETWVEAEFTDCFLPTPLEIHPEVWNRGTLTDDGLDGEGLYGPGTTGEDESPAVDAIWGTIRTAVVNTTAGGIVHVPARGVYRDETTITISDSVTIHGFSDADVILSGDDCFPSSGTSPATAITISIASGETVVLENLTIRNYTTAINASSSTGGTIILRNCRIEGNTTALLAGSGAESVELRVIDSRISDNTTGISGFVPLTLSDSEISNNSTASVTGSGSLTWNISGCLISDNGAGVTNLLGGAGTATLSVSNSRILRNGNDGIHWDINGLGVSVHDSLISDNDGSGILLKGQSGSAFSVTDTQVSGNTDDGIFVENISASCVDPAAIGFNGVVMHGRIFGNGDDGIDIGGPTLSCSLGLVAPFVKCGVLDNSISLNLDYGIVERTASSSFHCQVGENLISYNVSGAELGTGGVCTAASTSANQAN